MKTSTPRLSHKLCYLHQVYNLKALDHLVSVRLRNPGSLMRNLATGLLSVILCFAAAPTLAQIMYGKPVAIDGDTLDFGGQRVRLFGIDAPEKAQTCTRNGEAWPCGEDAKAMLQALVANNQVSCRQRDIDKYGRSVAICSVGRLDLSDALARAGYAVALEDFSADYVAAASSARSARLGIWSGEFQIPADFRASDPAYKAEIADLERREARARAQASAPYRAPAPARSGVYFRSCREAWAAGAAPLRRGQPGYRVEMDGDGDGVACEPLPRR
jgi:endonuclease YncB( thermonuclease family)